MRLSALLLCLAAGRSGAQQQWGRAECAGPLSVMTNGSRAEWQVVTSAGARGVAAGGRALSIAHNDRAYLVGACAQGDSFGPAMFSSTFNLLGQALNFTVDLSTAGCACNVAFYMVSMPGLDANGNPDPGEGDGYCDANDVDSQWCPEMDILEANTAALAVTPHTCSPPDEKGHYSACDKGGCSVNPHKSSPTLFGPGAGFTVDTTRPFSVLTAFPTDPATGNLASVTTTVAQGAASFVLSHTDATCGAGYLAAMTAPLAAGMVPAISVWGDSGQTMSWLDVPPCSLAASCADATAQGVFSDFSISPLAP